MTCPSFEFVTNATLHRWVDPNFWKIDNLESTNQGELVMTCVICESQDKEISCVGQFWVRQCAECGVYGIPGDLVEHLQEARLRLNPKRTQAFLASRTENQQAPWISRQDAEAHFLLEQC